MHNFASLTRACFDLIVSLVRPVSIASLLIAMGTIAGPAAASVGITPTSAIGLVRVANDGSVTVDVTVCATFINQSASLRLLFSSPTLHMLGVAIYGPEGGAVTNWCGTYSGISAALATAGADVAMDIRWSANNGNGLSEGHANAKGHVELPGPPPTPPKKTAQQAADLAHASNALWNAGTIIMFGAAVVAFGVFVLGTGGAGVPLAFAALGSTAYFGVTWLSDLAPPTRRIPITKLPSSRTIWPFLQLPPGTASARMRPLP